MAGDTLRGIGKKAIAEALEAATAAEHATEPNGTTGAPHAAADFEARPERSLDELPSERTGYPVNHSGAGANMATSITTATTLVQDASAAPPPAATTTEVDDAVPLTSTSTPRSGPNRVSFGTMIGHEMHAVQTRVAAAVAEADAGLRGTAHGHDVHLPAHPAMAVEPETAVATTSSPSLGVPAPHAQPAASPSGSSFAPVRDSMTEFSGGDHSFFETAPVNDEYEPENPRGRLYTRLAVSGAVVAVVSVVVVAWINSHGSAEEPPPIQVRAQSTSAAPGPAVAVTPPRPIAPPARTPEVPPTSTIPSSVPERIAVSVPTAKPPALAPPAPTPAPKPAPIAAATAKPAAKPVAVAAPAPAAKPTPAPVAAAPAPVRELRTPPPPPKKPTAVATAAPRAPAPTPPPRAAAPTPPPATRPAPPPVAKAPRPESAPARPVAKASPPPRPAKGSGRSKPKYDPDGTLPLSFE